MSTWGGNGRTNTLAGWMAPLIRGVTGTFERVSQQRLDRYVDEFAFRSNTRKARDAQRTIHALRKVERKRLMYRETKKTG
jgi:hypothetical protein